MTEFSIVKYEILMLRMNYIHYAEVQTIFNSEVAERYIALFNSFYGFLLVYVYSSLIYYIILYYYFVKDSVFCFFCQDS